MKETDSQFYQMKKMHREREIESIAIDETLTLTESEAQTEHNTKTRFSYLYRHLCNKIQFVWVIHSNRFWINSFCNHLQHRFYVVGTSQLHLTDTATAELDELKKFIALTNWIFWIRTVLKTSHATIFCSSLCFFLNHFFFQFHLPNHSVKIKLRACISCYCKEAKDS